MIIDYTIDETRVFHEDYGLGIIIDSDDDEEVYVRFDNPIDDYDKFCEWICLDDLYYTDEDEEDDYDVTKVDFEEPYLSPILPFQLVTPNTFHTQSTNDLLLLLI